MRLILKYIKPYWVSALLAPLFMIIGVSMDLMLPALMAFIVDKGIILLDLDLIRQTGYKMIAIASLALVSGISCTFFSNRASTGFSADLRLALYKKILSFDHAIIDKMEKGHLMTCLTSDIQQVEKLIRMSLRILVRAPMQIFGSLIMAIIISPTLSSIFLLLIPLILTVLFLVFRRSYPLYSLVQEQIDKINTILQENLKGIRLIKVFARFKVEEIKFEKINDSLMKYNKKVASIAAFSQPLLYLLLNLAIVAVLWLGGREVENNTLTIGGVIAFISYMMQLLMFLSLLSHLLVNITKAKASIYRIDELFSQRLSLIETVPSMEASFKSSKIEFKNVCFSYDAKSEHPLLDNISFKIEKGEKVAFLGSTGSGKSTIASLIPRLYDLSSGEILINDTNIVNYSLRSLRQNISYSPQKSQLFSGSIKDNILYGCKETNVNYKSSAECASINDFIESLPNKYETILEQRGLNLSGGQKQRLSIARSLARRASIIILDDSTSSVDGKTEKSIMESINQIQNKTVIIIAQKISSVVNAHRIILLDKGQIINVGTHEELLKSSLIYRDIVEIQSGLSEVAH